ncbi:Krueppel-like factor 9 [Platysternon megacephalum]|uniref:Krueppel-like factor 9 n=1 Tax=Platysternon megacephalum TaxID=55544 RepID=A0A4D9F1N2_9SAUR|nr:Krueppel-like factor 9 [Platysternon megacephalum]
MDRLCSRKTPVHLGSYKRTNGGERFISNKKKVRMAPKELFVSALLNCEQDANSGNYSMYMYSVSLFSIHHLIILDTGLFKSTSCVAQFYSVNMQMIFFFSNEQRVVAVCIVANL